MNQWWIIRWKSRPGWRTVRRRSVSARASTSSATTSAAQTPAAAAVEVPEVPRDSRDRAAATGSARAAGSPRPSRTATWTGCGVAPRSPESRSACAENPVRTSEWGRGARSRGRLRTVDCTLAWSRLCTRRAPPTRTRATARPTARSTPSTPCSRCSRDSRSPTAWTLPRKSTRRRAPSGSFGPRSRTPMCAASPACPPSGCLATPPRSAPATSSTASTNPSEGKMKNTRCRWRKEITKFSYSSLTELRLNRSSSKLLLNKNKEFRSTFDW